jgi:hypothetical protein
LPRVERRYLGGNPGRYDVREVVESHFRPSA